MQHYERNFPQARPTRTALRIYRTWKLIFKKNISISIKKEPLHFCLPWHDALHLIWSHCWRHWLRLLGWSQQVRTFYTENENMRRNISTQKFWWWSLPRTRHQTVVSSWGWQYSGQRWWLEGNPWWPKANRILITCSLLMHVCCL